MNCPIKGDVKYGYPEANEDASICLHAVQLEFTHPIKKEKVSFKAPTPSHGFWKYFLKFSAE
jgi:23S rRNA pseudouridine1911/1915/1917 synthase